MADTKITALAPIGAIDPANDVLPIVDVSNNSMAASGTTCRVTTNQLLQANAIASLASATISGDLTVDTNTLKVVAATDSVGVGFSPSAWAGGRKAIQIGSPAQLVSSDLTLEIGSNWWHDGTNYKYTAANPAALYSPSNGSHAWYNANAGLVNETIGWSTLMTLNSTGLNIANGNVILGTSGKGIDFSATASGSGTMTSELLSDYEEGTWTPQFADAATAGNVATAASAVGIYTKIGNIVTVQYQIESINTTGLTAGNVAYIRNLPFAITAAPASPGHVMTGNVAFGGFLSSNGVNGGTQILLYDCLTGGSLSTRVVSNFTSGSASVYGSFSYRVS